MATSGNFTVVGNTATVWRPVRWDDVIGQERNVRALCGMLKSGKLKQAFLLEGDHGTGKTTSARLFMATVNCANPKNMNPCGKCKSCITMLKSEPTNPDYLEIDGASKRGIDDIRALQNFVKYKPQFNLRGVCIDESHELTAQAQDALLKIYENPPPHLILFLATTKAQALKPTLISRAYRLRYDTPSIDNNVELMQRVCDAEEMKIPKVALKIIAKSTGNHTRDCLNMLSYLIDQMRYDKEAYKLLRENPEDQIASIVHTAPYRLVEDFTVALLSGKLQTMAGALRASENKVYFLKCVQELLVDVLYSVIGVETARTSIATRIKTHTKVDKGDVALLSKLVTELAAVQVQSAQYVVDAEHASIGLFVKYCNLFRGN